MQNSILLKLLGADKAHPRPVVSPMQCPFIWSFVTFGTEMCVFRSGPRFDSTRHLLSGRNRCPTDRAERADQAVVGGEPVPGQLAGATISAGLRNTELASQWLCR
jgi:hypothetical protein